MTTITDKTYRNMCHLVLSQGISKKNRTGVDTLGIFGHMAKFYFYDCFPILTTKKVNFDAIVHELLWFISGNTNIKYLVDNKVNIWNGDCYRHYCNKRKEMSLPVLDKDEWLEVIKNSPNPYPPEGDLGYGTYGSMWKSYPKCGHGCDRGLTTVNQLQKCIDTLRNNPNDRRMIVNSWHPGLVEDIALPPCHVMFQFNCVEYAGEKRILNLAMYQRSADIFLGVPFNISSYALLLMMVAQCVNMEVGELTIFYGDFHIYSNHFDQVKEQIGRSSSLMVKDNRLVAPIVKLNPAITDIFAFKFEDITLLNYHPHSAIKGEVSTNDITKS